MAKSYKNNSPWFSVVYGIFLIAITSIYYRELSHDHTIFHSSVHIFRYYGLTIVLCGIILTIWGYYRIKTISKLRFLIIILFLNAFAVYYYYRLLIPMPSQFRFALKNDTGQVMSDLRVIGLQELHLNKLEAGKKIRFAVNNWDEHHEINLVYKSGEKTDTINLAPGLQKSCGYFYAYDLKLANGEVIKQ